MRIEISVTLTPAQSLKIRIRNFLSSAEAQPCPERSVSGRGLMTMRTRAKRLGGKLEISPAATGWTVLLECPVIPAQAPLALH